MPQPLNLTNKKFGYLTALKKAPSKGKKTYWVCKCSLCGNEKVIQTSHLTSGATKTCGCQKQNSTYTFDLSKQQACLFCGKTFIPNNAKRKYCYECSPIGLSSAERLKFLSHKLKHRLIEYKGGRCERCGYNKCEGALQFHHKNPEEKEFTISHINFGEYFNIEVILSEIDKCELLCANCHAEEHYKE